MPEAPIQLREKHITGLRTRERFVNADQSPTFVRNHIQVVGMSDTTGDFDFVKAQPRFSQVVVCRGGYGLVLVDGEWLRCSSGAAFITPAYVPHAYRAVDGELWSISWVIYLEPDPRHLVIAADRTILIPATQQPLPIAIEGLWHESVGEAALAAMDCWSDLIHLYAQRIVKPAGNDSRLERLLREISSDIARPWTIDDLAHRACTSREHLRRLFHSHCGHSPMRHVTSLRMRHAATLLTSTPMTVETVAQRVGYDNPFAFSVAFKRHMHIAPSEYRTNAGRVGSGESWHDSGTAG